MTTESELLVAKIETAVAEMHAVSARIETAIVKMESLASDNTNRREFDEIRLSLLKQAMAMLPAFLTSLGESFNVGRSAPVPNDHAHSLLAGFLAQTTPEQVNLAVGVVGAGNLPTGGVLSKDQGALLVQIIQMRRPSRDLCKLADSSSDLVITDLQMEKLSKIFSKESMKMFSRAVQAAAGFLTDDQIEEFAKDPL